MESTFKNSSDVYNWIYTFVNVERGQNHRSFRLDRMKTLAVLAGNPEKCAPSIHTAGSKGKGSVTGMVSAILNAAGKKCSLYASPNVTDFRERISAGGVFFDEKIYAAAGNELYGNIKTALDSEDPAYDLFKNEKEEGEEPTFFELMTMWFFLCSRISGADIMAVETGMGGRLDATNILDPLASIITLIELEHTEYLGSTIAAIAGEKAGIIKNGRPVILAQQKNEALEVFRKKADETASPLFYFPEYCEINNIKLTREGTAFGLSIKNPVSGDMLVYDEINLSMYGRIQTENAGLAILAVKSVFPEISDAAVKKGLAEFTLPARFERLKIAQDLIIDGAHTPKSVENVIRTFTQLYGNNGILIFGCAASKDAVNMAILCIPYFSKIIITTPGTFKKSFPEEVYEIFVDTAADTKLNHKLGLNPEVQDIRFIPDTETAIKQALEMGNSLNLPILGTGSFYLAAEIKKFTL